MDKKREIKKKKYLKDESFLIELGNRLRVIRKEKNISQESLANTINVEISQISRLERGILNASVSLIKDLSIALDISLSEFFNFDYKKNMTNN